jgi:hypothetical protein
MGRDTEAEAFARELVEHAPPNTLAYQNGKKLFDEIAHAMRDRPNR